MDETTRIILNKLDNLNDGVKDLDKKFDVKFAELPVHFVTRLEYETAKKELTVTRRWTMGTVVSLIAIVISAIAVVL